MAPTRQRPVDIGKGRNEAVTQQGTTGAIDAVAVRKDRSRAQRLDPHLLHPKIARRGDIGQGALIASLQVPMAQQGRDVEGEGQAFEGRNRPFLHGAQQIVLSCRDSLEIADAVHHRPAQRRIRGRDRKVRAEEGMTRHWCSSCC